MTSSEEETYEEVTETGLIVVRGRTTDAVEGQSFIVDTDAVLPALPSEYRIWMPQDTRIRGTTAIAGEDRSGHHGEYDATIKVNPRPSVDLAIELGLHLRGRPLYIITANYSRWKRHERLITQSFGVEADPHSLDASTATYYFPDRPVRLHILRHLVRRRGNRAYGQIDWKGDVGCAPCTTSIQWDGSRT